MAAATAQAAKDCGFRLDTGDAQPREPLSRPREGLTMQLPGPIRTEPTPAFPLLTAVVGPLFPDQYKQELRETLRLALL
eukprot:3583386-Lingulodinium_polyedra.AAC.1